MKASIVYRFLTPIQRRRVIMRASGLLGREIAKIEGVSTAAIYKCISRSEKHVIRAMKTPLTSQYGHLTQKEARRQLLYDGGHRIADIARLEGVSGPAISATLKRCKKKLNKYPE